MEEELIEKVCNECGGKQQYKILQLGKSKIELIQKRCKCLEEKENAFREKQRIDKERKKQEERREHIEQLKRKCMLDMKFKNSTFSNWNKSESSRKVIEVCKNYYTNFNQNYSENIGMILNGGVGIGKTYAVSSIANELINDEISVICVSINSLLRRFKDNYSNGISENVVLKEISEVKLLIIDDLGTEQSSEWFNTIFYEIIDNRYRQDKPLIITTNLTIDQIEKKYHARITSRIFEMCVPINCGCGDIREIEGEKKLKKLALELQELN